MLVDSVAKFRIEKQRSKQEFLSPKNLIPNEIHVTNSQYSYQDIKRPLNNNHSDLSFKGLSSILYKRIDKVYSKSDFLKFTDKYFGEMGKELLDDVTIRRASRTSNMISVEGDNIVIHKKTIPHLAWDGILYPFKVLPGDMLNGAVELLGYVPGLGKWSQKTLQRPMFQNIRQRSKIDAKVNSLVGMITYKDVKLEEAAKKLGKKVSDLTDAEKAKVFENLDSNVFQTSMKMFDPKSGNYDTKHERSLNRLVSGLPPAIFLATDAHNLSIMMDGDDKEAKKEAKIRFRQEASRILTSGYLTLITMGAFQKFINSSKMGIVLTTGITVLVTEMFSRLSNGKHITRLTPEQARAENERLHAPEASIKPEAKKQVSSTGSANKSKEQQKPLLSFDTLMKASAVVLAAGYGIKGFKHIPQVKQVALNYFKKLEPQKLKSLGVDAEKLELKDAVKTFEDKVLYKPFTDFYKKLTQEKYIVNSADFDKAVEMLRKVEIPVIKDGQTVMVKKYEQFANQYEQIGKSVKKYKLGDKILENLDGLSEEEKKRAVEVLDFGMKDKKIKPAVNFVIAPFKFIWNTITLPYWMIDEKLMSVFVKNAAKKAAPKDIDALAKSFDKISKRADAFRNGKMSEEEFKDFIEINLKKSFNADSLSSVSNAELSNLAKTAASIATIWFLMTDNYNMVMLKSNGNDKDGANTKFKERFVQEGSRLFYQTLLIDLFNSTFAKQYNASLWGMSWVTLTDTTLGEILTRSSVGMTVKPHTREELIAIEEAQDKSTGLKKKYYNFMQRLTGKRSIKTYDVKPKNQPAATPESSQTVMSKQIFFQNNETLDKLIKG